MVMQKCVLFKGTIRENLQWGAENATDAEMWEALHKAQAADFVRRQEGQLDALVEQEGRNYSGGQKQRLTIARALIRRPPVLIFDDSASALDYLTEAALRQELKKLTWPVTTFIISQRAGSVSHADQIIVLEDGRMVGSGRHEELINSCEVYREIFASQS
jgi:ABC-type multidrug transport system fused ATPase/permease subunit